MKYKATRNQKEIRQKLLQYSRAAKQARDYDPDRYPTYNSYILESYAKELSCDASDFKSYVEWKNEGKQVKKGEKGYPIWSAPRIVKIEIEHAEMAEVLGIAGSDVSREFFGIAYVFNRAQVE